MPALADAATAADLRLTADEANRARKALEALVPGDGSTLEELPATRAAIEPLLRAATPETFGVTSMKSLENKKTLVRKAVRLVDPLTSGGRETAISSLPMHLAGCSRGHRRPPERARTEPAFDPAPPRRLLRQTEHRTQ
jgi:hypothetical protein